MTHSHSSILTHQPRLRLLLGILPLVGAALLVAPAPVAQAASFTVNTTSDGADLLPGDGVCDASAQAGEQCTLRAAIQTANATAGADTISLPSGTYTLTIAGTGEDNGATGDLDITRPLTINSTGATSPIIDGSQLDRVIDISDPSFVGTAVTISNVVIQNGRIDDSGGGILIRAGGNLTLTGSVVRGSTSSGGDGAGGIYVQGSSMLNLLNSSVINNTVIAGNGGGIVNNNMLIATNSTISGNVASLGSGGGIFNNGTASLNNVTIANNSSNNAGGVSVATSTTFTFQNTLIAGNMAGGQQPSDCGGVLTSGGYNIVARTVFCTITGDTTGTVTGVSPNLGPLADNGGPTPTHALLPGSLGIDVGSPAAPGSGGSACAATDQRGLTRPQDGNSDGSAICDIGAVEVQIAPTIQSLNPTSANAGGPTFTLQVNGSNFATGATVQWNGANRPTTFISSTQLNAQISAADIATTGTANVTVVNPAPGGSSNSVTFSITTLSTPSFKLFLPIVLRGG